MMIKNKLEFIIGSNIRVLLFIVIVNFPFILLTWNTGYWSDDYQLLNLQLTKFDISGILRNFQDFIEVRSDGHVLFFFYIYNIAFSLISKTPQGFHLIVIACFILTAYFIYLIVCLKCKDKITGILTIIIFSFGYSLAFKALSWNCFHSHVTNSLTGVVALYISLKYQTSQKFYYLIGVFIFISLTIFNMESGFVFPVMIGVHYLYSFCKKDINFQILLKIIIVLIMSVSLYIANTIYSTGDLFPILSDRVAVQLNDDNKNKDDILRMRSTYGSRDLKTLTLRVFDLSMKILNLSYVESKARNALLSYMYKRYNTEWERKKWEEKIKKIALKWMIPIGLIWGVVCFFLIYFLYRQLSNEVVPFFYCFVVSFVIFVVIFNRIDIANAVGVFSSIVFADLIIQLIKKKGIAKKLGIGILLFFVLMPSLIIIDKFEGLYNLSFANGARENLRIHAKLYIDINEKIGHYTENAVVFAYPDKRRSATFWLNPSPIDNLPFYNGDLSHLNIRMFQDDFVKSGRARNYINKSLIEMTGAQELRENIKIFVAYSEAEVRAYIKKKRLNLKEIDVIYVDKQQKVKKINTKGKI